MTTITDERLSTVASSASTTPEPRTGSLFRVVWRWHFYAGVTLSPIIFTMALTGLLYLFNAEIERTLRSDLYYVTPGSQTVSYQAQIAAAHKVRPEWIPGLVMTAPEKHWSTLIELEGPEEGQHLHVYTNPYTGTVLGSYDGQTDALHQFFEIVLKIHRQLFLGTTGRIITELATCWLLILFATGVYLWWPRDWSTVRGVWWPRWGAKKYVVLRDLHSQIAIYCLPLLALISGTGMFYTLVWGMGAMMTSTVACEGIGGVQKLMNRKPKEDKLGDADLTHIDQVLAAARAEFPHRFVLVGLREKGSDGFSVAAFNDFSGGTYGRLLSDRYVAHPQAGTITDREVLSEHPQFWLHGWTYPLHVGSFWGLTTKIPWAIACLVMMGLPVTGLWMWWQRRPVGRTGFPRRPELRLPRSVIVLISAVGLFLPVAGISMVLLLACEWLYCRFRRHRTPAVASAS